MVSLSKGQTVSLEKSSATPLTKVVMGLGWDAKKKKALFGLVKMSQDIDLDASCIVFDKNKKMLDTVWFRQLKSKDGSIQHRGDNRTGEGEGDDEQIVVDLPAVSAQANSLVFVVNSFSGQTFDEIENASCRLVDHQTNNELAKYSLTGSGSHTAQIMAKLSRDGKGWQMTAIGEQASGRTFQDLLPAVVKCL
ncbi:MAG: tellurium resistance TerZ family protein [Magnetococcus sp. DMHC-1]